MDFSYSTKTIGYIRNLNQFVQAEFEPYEAAIQEFNDIPENAWTEIPLFEQLKSKAKNAGLWNLFLPPEYGEYSPGLTNVEYAPLAELMGRSETLSEVFNCSAPDTGNMEVLAKYGSADQKERWLLPLLEGSIRSSFLMTEPEVASSDATNISCSIVREGDEYVINGHKWWATGALHPQNKIFIVMERPIRKLSDMFSSP